MPLDQLLVVLALLRQIIELNAVGDGLLLQIAGDRTEVLRKVHIAIFEDSPLLWCPLRSEVLRHLVLHHRITHEAIAVNVAVTTLPRWKSDRRVYGIIFHFVDVVIDKESVAGVLIVHLESFLLPSFVLLAVLFHIGKVLLEALAPLHLLVAPFVAVEEFLLLLHPGARVALVLRRKILEPFPLRAVPTRQPSQQARPELLVALLFLHHARNVAGLMVERHGRAPGRVRAPGFDVLLQHLRGLSRSTPVLGIDSLKTRNECDDSYGKDKTKMSSIFLKSKGV